VLLRGQCPDLVGIVGDCLADARNPWRVGHREVVSRFHRNLGDNLDLAAEVHQKRPVRDVDDLNARDPADRSDDLLELPGVRSEHGDVPDLRRPLDAHEIDRAERPAGRSNRSSEACERSGMIGEPYADGRTE